MNNYSLTLPHSYSKLHPIILDQNYVKKVKSDVVFYSMIWCWSCNIIVWTIYNIVSYVCGYCTLAWTRFSIVYRVCCYYSNAFVDSCVTVWWCVDVCSFDCNCDVTYGYYYDYKFNVI